MRILHVTDGFSPHVGGIEVFVEDLARRQAWAGHDVTVLTAEPEPAVSDGSAERWPFRLVRTPPTLLHPLAPGEAREVALTGPYDVVHAHLSVVSPFATAVARATDEAGLTTVNTVHSMWASRRAVVRAVRALAEWDRSTIAWTTVSHAAAAEMQQVLRPGTPVDVVPNAVDVAWWRAGRHADPGRAQVTVISVMRLAGRKRPFAFLDVLERVRANVGAAADLRAVVVGDGPLGPRLRAEISAGGLADWVTMTGMQTRAEIRARYRSADIYLAPAHHESFGIAALEARAAGLPVVAMETGGVGAFVAHGVEGLLCRDDDALVAGLTTLVTDTALRSKLALHNATQPPVQDWPHTLAAFDDVYVRAQRRDDVRRSSAPVTGRA
jgi:phosphatidylinositol alpha 1,6-mannosyltransferase